MPESRSPSMSSLGMLAMFAALVAAIFGIRSGGSGSGSPQEKSGPVAAEAADNIGSGASYHKDPPRKCLSNLLRGRAATHGEIKDEADGRDAECPDQLTESERGRVHSLIVSVPDPVDTSFGFWFDQSVESLTRAAVEYGYVPAGHWFPWEDYRPPSARSDGAKAAANLKFLDHPGILLFREKEKSDDFKIIAVLLVGETPTSVRRDALIKALDLVRDVQLQRNGPAQTVRLIAPYFTGPWPSLRHALGEWSGLKENFGKVGKFELVSGTATGLKALRDSENKLVSGPELELRVTIVPAEFMRNAAIQFLKRWNNKRTIYSDEELTTNAEFCRDVAILTEYNTPFGASQKGPGNQEPDNDLNQPLVLQYPMYLSRLYAKYAKERQDREQRVGGLRDSAKTGISSREPRPNPDTVTSLDVDTTPPINDRTIDDITATLLRERIRYVGIVSTSPQDKVFLVERIREACPNVTIFIHGIESYYALPENRFMMRGVIFASSYPHYPANAEWTNPNDRRRQMFISNGGQGDFNAAVYHLGNMLGQSEKIPNKLQEHVPPKFLRDQRPKSAFAPPVWIMTLNENGRFVPLEVFDEYHDNGLMLTSAPPDLVPGEQGGKKSVSRPVLGPFRIVVLLTLAVAIGAMIWLVFGAHGKWEVSQTGADQPKTAERPVSIYQFLAHAAIVIGVIPIVIAIALLLDPWYERQTSNFACLLFFLGIASAVVGSSLGIQAAMLARILKKSRSKSTPILPDPEHGSAGSAEMPEPSPAVGNLYRGVVLFLILCELLFVAFSIGWPSMADRTARYLFAERAVGIVNGYSVLSPVLLLAAGFLAKALFGLHKRYIAGKFKIDCPYPDNLVAQEVKNPLVASACEQISRLADELHEDLTNLGAFAKRRGWELGVGAAALVLLAMILKYRTLRISEGDTWTLLFLGAFLFLILLIGLDLYRFICGWKTLSKILDKIALIPMVRAFDRLPRKTSTLFAGYFFTHRPQGSHLVVPYHLLRQLGTMIKKESSIATDIAKVLQSADRAANDDAYPGRQINALNGISRSLIADLADDEWWKHTADDAFGQDDSDGAESPKPRTARIAAAEPAAHDQDGGGSPNMNAVKRAEDFIAIQVLIFISQYMILLKTMAWSMICMALALLFAATVYPFQPERLILILVLVVMMAVGLAIFNTLVAYNKNEIISRATHSTPNKFELTWSFVFNVVTFVGPLILVVAAHLSGRLRSLVEPMLEGIR